MITLLVTFISCVQIFLRNLRERRRSIYSKCLSLGILVLEKPALSRDMYINFSLYTTELQYPFFKVNLKEMQLQFVAKSLWYCNECSFKASALFTLYFFAGVLTSSWNRNVLALPLIHQLYWRYRTQQQLQTIFLITVALV